VLRIIEDISIYSPRIHRLHREFGAEILIAHSYLGI
jgi:hypothetical protein